MPSVLILIAAAAAMATSAGAQTASPRDGVVTYRAAAPGTGATRPAIDLSRPGASSVLAYARRDAAGMTGFPRTAISGRLAPDGPVGSLGYLCGIKPFAPDYYGVGAGPASGFDRGLTFLGVKLDYAFR